MILISDSDSETTLLNFMLRIFPFIILRLTTLLRRFHSMRDAFNNNYLTLPYDNRIRVMICIIALTTRSYVNDEEAQNSLL